MTNQSSLTSMTVANCELMVLQDNASRVGAGLVNPSYVSIGNFQYGVPGMGLLPQVSFANSGVSVVNSPGGWDLLGPPGPNSHCYIWAVSDGIVGSPGTSTKYGLVLSQHGSNGGPQLDPSWTHSLRIGWNFSNQSGDGFAYSVIRNGLRTYFVGGQGDSGSIPVIFTGVAARWTPISCANFCSENVGGMGLRIRNYTPASLVGISPNQYWGALPLAYIDNNPNAVDLSIVAEVFTDAGAPCVWSTSATGSVSMAYFDDNL
jgi:hypothetical protein